MARELAGSVDVAWLDGGPLPFGVVRERQIFYANGSLARLLGYEREELVGMEFSDLVAPEDRERVVDRHVRRRRGEIVPASYELTARRRDGAPLRVELHVALVDDTIVFQLRDVTERAAREAKLFALERLGAALQSARTADAVFDAVTEGLGALGLATFCLVRDGDAMRIIHASMPGALGVAFEQAIGQPPVGVRVGAGSPVMERAFREGVSYAEDMYAGMDRFFGRPLGARAHEIARAAGLACSVAVRIDAASFPSSILMMTGSWPQPSDLPAFRLFGAQVSAAFDAVQAQQQLVQRERLAALGELAAVVAHEVRNPLGVMFNSLGSIRRLLRPEGDAKLLMDIMGEEAARLNRIVTDLLDFARPAMPELQPEPLDRVLDDVIAFALRDASQRIEVVREIDPELPKVPIDSRLFRQAVLNIAINALHAMPDGGRLTVRVRHDPATRTVRIALGDSGQGVAASDLPRIFEPFFTTKATGTGLGLAVVKRIIESHRGEVHVESAPGVGTTFTIVLPLA